MNTNCFGAVRCIKAVLPQMRKRRSGCIVNVSIHRRQIANSPLSAYCASQFALEAFSEALAAEVRPFKIRVALVEPGIQDTRMARDISKGPQSIYPQVDRFSGLFRASLANLISPDASAIAIRDIIESGTWQLRHLPGPNAAPFVGWRASMTDEQWIDWNLRRRCLVRRGAEGLRDGRPPVVVLQALASLRSGLIYLCDLFQKLPSL